VTQLLSIRNIQNVWISLFAKNTGKAILSLDWLWDGPLYNETKFGDIILNTMPLLIVQAYNNTAIGIWTTIAIFNFILASVLVIDLFWRYGYYVLVRKKKVSEVSNYASIFYWFCIFEIASQEDKDRKNALKQYTSALRDTLGARPSHASGVQVIEMAARKSSYTGTGSPLHGFNGQPRMEPSKVLDIAVKSVLRTPLQSEDLYKQILLLVEAEEELCPPPPRQSRQPSGLTPDTLATTLKNLLNAIEHEGYEIQIEKKNN